MAKIKKATSTTRAGRFVQQPGGFKAFVPEPLPPVDLAVDQPLQSLLSRADQELGRLDGVISLVPNPDLFVFMYVRREAVLSSQIEGTQASLMDVLEFEALRHKSEERIDVAEIVNYIAATRRGLELLGKLPVSRRLLCDVHGVLMDGVRGGEPERTPGEFRRSQNWIGGASPATARFVPPPWEEVAPSFANLEAFLHDDAPMPALIKIGLAHAQFETIHPFLDGNGRIGRLLITLWLIETGILRSPLLYPSLFLKEHRDEYVARLQAIRDSGAWESWLAFFLDGIALVAREATDRALDISRLREHDRELIIRSLGKRAPNALKLLDKLFVTSVVQSKGVESMIDVSQPTASALVRELTRVGILVELTGRQRDRLFAYQRYLDLFPGAESRG